MPNPSMVQDNNRASFTELFSWSLFVVPTDFMLNSAGDQDTHFGTVQSKEQIPNQSI